MNNSKITLTGQFLKVFFTKLIIFEFYYLFTLLQKFFYLFYSNNVFKIKNLILYFFKFKYNTDNLLFEKFKKINKYDYFSINFKIKNKIPDLVNNFKSNTTVINNILLNNNKNDFFFKKLINLFFLFNYFILDVDFKFHYLYKHLFVSFYSKNIIINNNKFITKWIDFYLLMFNIFYFNFKFLTFGSFLFKNEILALNWNWSSIEIGYWKYFYSFFIFKTNRFSENIDFFFKRIYDNEINFSIITDCYYHYKNIYYLKKNNIYILGLTNSSINPWSIDFAIPTLNNNFFSQFFFFKFLILISKYALNLKYLHFKQSWFNFFYFNKTHNLNFLY